MMGGIPLITAAHNHCPASPCGNLIQIAGKHGLSPMPPHISAKGKADHKRPYQRSGIALQITQRHQNIALRKSWRILGHQIVVLQIWLRLAQLYHYNIRLRRRPLKAPPTH